MLFSSQNLMKNLQFVILTEYCPCYKYGLYWMYLIINIFHLPVGLVTDLAWSWCSRGWCLPRLSAGRREPPQEFGSFHQGMTHCPSQKQGSIRPVSTPGISLGTKMGWGWARVWACKWAQKGCAVRSWRPCLLQPCWSRSWWPGAEMGLWTRNRLEKCWSLVRDTQE